MIDFVVRTKNEKNFIGKNINSIRKHFGSDSKIIIVDNNSSDSTLDVIKEINDSKIVVENILEYYPGKSLNLGILHAQSDIIGIVSAHCEIIDFDMRSLDCFRNPLCFGLMGEQIPIKNNDIDYDLKIWGNFRKSSIYTNIKNVNNNGRYFFHNAFSFISKKIWEVNKFDENCLNQEDIIWAEKNISCGYHFLFDNRIKVNHYFTENGATWKRKD